MRRLVTVFVSLALGLGLLVGTAWAGGHEWEHVPAHAHAMLIGVELQETNDGLVAHYKKCVEFKKLRTPAHHHSIHTGNAGGSPFAPGALFNAGNWVVPLQPLTPFGGCDDIPNPLPLPEE